MDIVHYSVLWKEALEYLKPDGDNQLFIDGTLGEGGHTELFLKEYPTLKTVGLDADADIMKVAKERLAPFGGRTRFFNTWFNQFYREYPLGDERPDLILFDLGISVFHYEKGNRGFSFQTDEPLDMRLGGDLELSACDIVNQYPEKELADLIYKYGEERYSRRIATALVRERKGNPIETTARLADIIRGSVPAAYRHGRIHPATRTFQAIRIVVNGELVRLESVLQDSLRVLKPGGRMGVISFHSLEDRIVKQFFKYKNQLCTCPPEQPICNCGGRRTVEILTKKPICPSEEEVRENPPSRSAKLRVVRKLEDEDV
ncbi:MAG: 16S rRNA (cytosine(1402)-N(4))-methyltransferase RsmH [Spirochaetales bacterium]|nr:16S rRNA (cytosine(1402)-N(4))-methyltransferase RsmH [Spirochaetales bacterium]